MSIITLPQAEADIDEAFRWYERQCVGLGDELLEEIDRLLKRIEQFPEGYAVVYRNYRSAILRRFPFSLIYTVTDDSIRVYSLLHGSQSPRKLRRKLS